MTAPSKARPIFLDSSVILGYVFDESNPRLRKFRNDVDRHQLA